MKIKNIFDDEEQQFLNSLTQNQKKSECNHEGILKRLHFSKISVNKDDVELLNLIDNLIKKLCSITDAEWEIIIEFMPFPVNISADDIVDELNYQDAIKNTFLKK